VENGVDLPFILEASDAAAVGNTLVRIPLKRDLSGTKMMVLGHFLKLFIYFVAIQLIRPFPFLFSIPETKVAIESC
jgi:hypothetical protein